MLGAMLALVLTSLVVSAPPPNAVEQAFRRAPQVNLPVTPEAGPRSAPVLSPTEGAAVLAVLSNTKDPALAPLVKRWRTHMVDTRAALDEGNGGSIGTEGRLALSLFAVGAFTIGTARALLLGVFEESPADSVHETWLIVARDGSYDGFLLATDFQSEAGQGAQEATIRSGGRIDGTGHMSVVLHEVDGASLEVRWRTEGTVAPPASSRAYTSQAGWYEDTKSHERLLVLDAGKVLYGGVKKSAKLQPLQVTSSTPTSMTVTFTTGGKPYALSFDEPNSTLKCRNPDGTVQTFARVW